MHSWVPTNAGKRGPFGRLSAALAAALCATCLLLAREARAVGTAAGTPISNSASVTADVAGIPVSVTSNVDVIVVEELLDTDVTLQSAGNVLTPSPATDRVLAFRVTNIGNGVDTVALTGVGAIAGDDFDPAVTSLVLDANGNGVYDPGVDTPYAAGLNDPVLDANDPAADDVVVFLLASIPAALADGNLGFARLQGTSTTGSGAPGTVIAGGGDGGAIDAVVGPGGAQDDAQGAYQVSSVQLQIAKSSSVADPFGGAQPLPGATITYTFVVTATGSGDAANVVVTDPIPANTTYVAGSMTLDAVAQTDASDAPTDDADFSVSTPGAITVGLGTLPAGGPARTVTFAVTID
jgi:uncharacterized repeat protein (TIGR01451 family)